MTRPWVINLSKRDVENLIGRPGMVCISISEPEWEASLRGDYDAVLRVKFHDIDPDRIDLKKYPNALDGYKLFDKQQAREIAAFIKLNKGKNFVVHCAAGISRSGAVVETILELWPKYQDLGKNRYPNGLVKRLLKRALGMAPKGARTVGLTRKGG